MNSGIKVASGKKSQLDIKEVGRMTIKDTLDSVETMIRNDSLIFSDVIREMEVCERDPFVSIAADRVGFARELIKRVIYYEADYRSVDGADEDRNVRILNWTTEKMGSGDSLPSGWEDLSSVSDTVYDCMLFTAKHLVSLNKMDKEIKLLNVLGDEKISGKKVRHMFPLFSLDNLFNEMEIVKWWALRNDLNIETILAGWDGVDMDSLVFKLDEEFKGRKLRKYMLEPKVDGAGVSLQYDDGYLIKAATRGSSDVDATGNRGGAIVGESVIHNAPYFNGIKTAVEFKGAFQVIGEVYMLEEDLEALNEYQRATGGKIYKNTRNTATSLFRTLGDSNTNLLLTSGVCKLRIKVYGVESEDPELAQLKYKDAMELVCGEYDFGVEASSIGEIIAHYRSSLSTRFNQGMMPIDGMVIKENIKASERKIKGNSKVPLNNIAVKFPAETKRTKVGAVVWQTGPSGAITPVATLSPPVELLGSVVEKVSLSNITKVRELGVCVGATVVVGKSGDVIPEVYSVEDAEGMSAVELPATCDSCGGEAKQAHPEKGLSDSGENTILYCQSLDCCARAPQQLASICDTKLLNISIGEKSAEMIVEQEWYQGTADIFTMSYENLREILVANDGKKIKESKVAENIIKDIDALKNNLTINKLVIAMKIPAVKVEAGHLLANHYLTYDRFIEACIGGEISEIDGIGPVIEKTVKEYLSKDYNTKLIEVVVAGDKDSLVELSSISKVLKAGDKINNIVALKISDQEKIDKIARELKIPQSNGQLFLRYIREGVMSVKDTVLSTNVPLKGKSIAVTGKLSVANRKDIQEAIKALGGKASSSVSKNTFVLVVGADAGSKLTKAKEADVAIIDAENMSQEEIMSKIMEMC